VRVGEERTGGERDVVVAQARDDDSDSGSELFVFVSELAKVTRCPT